MAWLWIIRTVDPTLLRSALSPVSAPTAPLKTEWVGTSVRIASRLSA